MPPIWRLIRRQLQNPVAAGALRTIDFLRAQNRLASNTTSILGRRQRDIDHDIQNLVEEPPRSRARSNGPGPMPRMRRMRRSRRSSRYGRRRSYGRRRPNRMKRIMATGSRMGSRSRFARRVRALKDIKVTEGTSTNHNFLTTSNPNQTQNQFNYAKVYDPPAFVTGSGNNENNCRLGSDTYCRFLHFKGTFTHTGNVTDSAAPVKILVVVRAQTVASERTNQAFLDTTGRGVTANRSRGFYHERLNPRDGLPIYKKWIDLNAVKNLERSYNITIPINRPFRHYNALTDSQNEWYLEIFYFDDNANTPATAPLVGHRGTSWFSFVDGH